MTETPQISPTTLAPEGSFRRAEQEILLQGMRSTFAEKLQWLEEACDFADAIAAKREGAGNEIA